MRLIIEGISRAEISDDELMKLQNTAGVIIVFQGHLVNLEINDKRLAQTVFSLIFT